MLFALASPFSLVLLVLGFVAACTLAVGVRILVDRPVRAGWSTAAGSAPSGLRGLHPRHTLDVFGAVAVLLTGVGWARLPAAEQVNRTRRIRFVSGLLAGCLADVAVGVALIAGYLALAGEEQAGLGPRGVLSSLLREGVGGALSDPAASALLLLGAEFAMVGLLGLVPLPPLPGGHVLLAFTPATTGWQKVRHYLVDQQIGVAVLIGLAIIGLPESVLLFVVDLLFRVLLVPLAGG